MTQNVNNLQMLLQKAVADSTSTVDQLLLAKAIQSLRMGQIRTVATFAALPSAASNEGLLVWVTADERMYWSTGSTWQNLIDDNRGLTFSWGCNNYGQLGDSSTTNRSSPVCVVGGFADWSTASAGTYQSLATRSNGTAWAWGRNNGGQLGNNSTVNTSSATSVVGSFGDWCRVNSGGTHSLGIRTNGSTWAWGTGSAGRLGNLSILDRSSPVSVVGGFTNWCGISAGAIHSLGVTTDGSAWAWGNNGSGRLGDGTTIARSSPVSVVGGFVDWCSIGAGGFHSLATRSNGTAWAWGCNDEGRLGNNSTVQSSSPVSVVGGFADWCAVSAGQFHSTALRTNGSAWGWGNNGSGRLGNLSTVNVSSPVSVVGGFSNWCCISAGTLHSAGSRASGTAWAWGVNNGGAIGDNSTTQRSSPVCVAGGFSDWCSISAGGCHTLGLRTTNFL